METEVEASKRGCELLRKQYFNESEIITGAFDDDFIINRYPDEWGWFMQGWKECKGGSFWGRAAARLSEENKKLKSAMQEFVDRVNKGEIKSKYTYAKFKELLSS